MWDRWDKSWFWNQRRGATFEKIEDGALGFGKAYELDAGPDDAIRSRSCISNLTRDRHIDGGTELKAQRNATTHIQAELTVLPQTEKFNWVGIAKVYPHTKRRDVDDRALPPQVQWLVLDMATAHPRGRLSFCPSAILHGLSPNRAQRRLAEATHPSTSFDQSPDRIEQHRENTRIANRRYAGPRRLTRLSRQPRRSENSWMRTTESRKGANRPRTHRDGGGPLTRDHEADALAAQRRRAPGRLGRLVLRVLGGKPPPPR